MGTAIKVEKPHSYLPVPDSHQEGEGLLVVNVKLDY